MPSKFIECLTKSYLDKAYFLYQYALGVNWDFVNLLFWIFGGTNLKISGAINSNLVSIAREIEENQVDEEEDKAFRVADSIKATIAVERPDAIMEVYNMLKKSGSIEILRVKNHLEENVCNVAMNIMYNRHIIGEVEIACGAKPPNYLAREFLVELSKSDSAVSFR